MKDDPSAASSTPRSPSERSASHVVRRWLGPVLLVVALILAGRWMGSRWPEMEAFLRGLGAWAYVAFSFCFVALTSLCFPVSVLGVSAGLLFGPWRGFGVVFVSVALAGSAMFALGRGLLRGRIQRTLADRPKLAAVDRMVGRRAVRLNLLARLSPLNYGLVCYTLAAGRTDFRSYLIGLAATMPSLALQVWIGDLARRSQELATDGRQASLGHWILLGSGLVFFGLLGWQIRRLVQSAWSEMEGATDDR